MITPEEFRNLLNREPKNRPIARLAVVESVVADILEKLQGQEEKKREAK